MVRCLRSAPEPVLQVPGGPPGANSSLFQRSSQAKMKSSAEKGSPFDHRRPWRRCSTWVLPPSLNSQLSARPPRMLLKSSSMRRMSSVPITAWGSPKRWLALPMATTDWPPYRPTSSLGTITSGLGGRRSSTGGSSPAATRSASIGDSPNRLPVSVAGASAAGAAAGSSGSGACEQAVTASAAEATAVPLRKARRSILVQSAITHSCIESTTNTANQQAPRPGHTIVSSSAAAWSTNQSGTEKLAAATVSMTNSNMPFQYSNCVWDEPWKVTV